MPELQYATTAAGDLAYVRQGAGEPLLLVMGVGGHHRMWGEAFLADLARDFDVVAFDHRGIGSSHRAEEQFTVDDLAAATVDVLDHLGWDRAHLMGISMGGTVVQAVTLAAPERVRSLVLGCTWPGASIEGGPWGASVLDLATAADSGDPMTSARLMFAANVSPEFAGRDGAFEDFVGAAAAAKVPGPVILMQMRAANDHDAVERLGAIDVPTLVLHGTADQVIRFEAGEELAKLVPGARFEPLEGAGHLFFWERPEESAALVRDFLRS